MPKNIFDQFDAQSQPAPVQETAPAAAPAPTQSKNVFDQFDNHTPPVAQPMDKVEYTKQLHQKLQDPKETTESIMDWSGKDALRPITDKNAVDYYVKNVRGGTIHPDDVRIGFNDTVNSANPEKPKTSAIGAFLRNAAQGGTLDWGDEIGDAIGATLDPLRGDGTNQTWQQRYDRLHATDKELSDADSEQHPWASKAGYASGIVGSAFIPIGDVADGIRGIKTLANGTRVAADGTTIAKAGKIVRTAKAAATGAGMAATDAAGASDPGNRVGAAEEAAPVGAVLGPLAEPVVRMGGKVVGAVANKTGITDALDVAAGKVNDWARKFGIDNPQIWNRIPAEIKALAQRARVNPDQIQQMQQAAETFRNAGVAPRTVDVVTPTQQDAVASIIRKDQGAGRDAAYLEARNESNQLGTNVKSQFDRVTNVGSADLNSDLDRIGERQNYRASDVMGQLRHNPLPISSDVVNVLNTRVGRAALNEATKAADPETREAMLRLPDLMTQLHGIGPAAREQILRQYPNPFTVGMADRVRIALNDAAENASRVGKGGLAGDIRRLRDTIRTAAGQSDPKYADYLKNYGEDAKSLEAADLGRTALDRNTDEFVPKAQGLSDDPNAVLNKGDTAPSQGKYTVDRDSTDAFTEGRNLRITRHMDDGTKIHYNITAPAKAADGKYGELSVTQTDANGRQLMYGDKSGFNTVGPAEMRDAVRYFHENYGGPGQDLSHIEGFTGHRVGGARDAAQVRQMRANLQEQAGRERNAGIITEYDSPEQQAAHEFADRHGYHMGATVDEFAQHVDDPHNLANTVPEDLHGSLTEIGHDINEPGAREFTSEVARQLRERGQLAQSGGHAAPTGEAAAARDVGSPNVRREHYVDDNGTPRTSNGLTYEDVRDQYHNYLNLHDQHAREGEEPLSFHHWATEMFHQNEMPDHFWSQARAEDEGGWNPGIMDDESGSKRLPDNARQRAIDYINSRRSPPPPPQPGPATGPVGTNGVTNTGVDTRVRNARPEGLSNSESYHAAKPREVLTDSDRQLATAAMSRTIESKTGEGVRGAYEVGRKMAYAPEQQTRNAALLGDSVAAEVQRAMDATMRKASNTARIAPSTGSPTAIREGDDSVTQLVNAFGHAATGNKVGLLRNIGGLLAHAGITPKQSSTLIKRVLDPTQTDQVIRELSTYMGRDTAMEVTRHIRRLAAQGVGQTAAANQ